MVVASLLRSRCCQASFSSSRCISALLKRANGASAHSKKEAVKVLMQDLSPPFLIPLKYPHHGSGPERFFRGMTSFKGISTKGAGAQIENFGMLRALSCRHLPKFTLVGSK